MAKVLFLIMAGDEKFDLGIRIAYNSLKSKRFEDTKVIFFGPSQKRLAEASGEIKNMILEMLRNNAIDSACVNVAQSMNIKAPLESLGINLMPSGERVGYYVNQGYEVITI